MDHLLQLRLAELSAALTFLARSAPKHGALLEIGAGTGHQARELARLGFSVTAIDVAEGPYQTAAVFPVQTYNGEHLPFPDSSFDVVFSSNVLEHVPTVDGLLKELYRVLRPGGVALHLIPTSAWRFWSLISHYGWLTKRLTQAASGQLPDSKRELGRISSPKRDAGALLISLFPARHGVAGTAITELWTYRRKRWTAALERSGLHLVADYGAGLFYTNANIFGQILSIRTRRALAGVLGSACRIYCFRKPA